MVAMFWMTRGGGRLSALQASRMAFEDRSGHFPGCDPMSAVGQTLQKPDVRVMSAFPLIATECYDLMGQWRDFGWSCARPQGTESRREDCTQRSNGCRSSVESAQSSARSVSEDRCSAYLKQPADFGDVYVFPVRPVAVKGAVFCVLE
jgi:hypothetical protein